MKGKSIPLNNSQREEWLFILTGSSWYLDKVKPCHSDGMINILRVGNTVSLFRVLCGILVHGCKNKRKR